MHLLDPGHGEFLCPTSSFLFASFIVFVLILPGLCSVILVLTFCVVVSCRLLLKYYFVSHWFFSFFIGYVLDAVFVFFHLSSVFFSAVCLGLFIFLL